MTTCRSCTEPGRVRLEEEVAEKVGEGVDDEEGGEAEEGAEGELVAGSDGEADGVGVTVGEAAAGGAYGESTLPPGGVKRKNGGDADDAAEKSAEEDGEKGSRDAEEGANHGHHFDVAHAHAIAVADEFIEKGGGEKEQAAESGAEEGVEDREGRGEEVLRGGVSVKIGEWESGLKAGEEHVTGGIVRGDAGGEGQAQAEAEEGDGVGEEADAEVSGKENDDEAAKEEPFEGG